MHPVEVLFLPLGRLLRRRRPDEAASITHAPGLATGGRFTLSSPSFGDGQVIPARHCGMFIGDDISPALTWGDLPSGTKGLVLILEDIDTPTATPGIHTIAAFGPVAGGLAEGALTPTNPDIHFFPVRRGRANYYGPRPLPGHGPHRYRFHLYALDTLFDLATIRAVDQLPAALDGHVLASGLLTGTRMT